MMSTTPPAAARLSLSRRIQPRLAVVALVLALYPPLAVFATGQRTSLAHRQDILRCTTFYMPSGIVKQACTIQNASPLFGVVTVLTIVLFPTILATLASGYLAVQHQRSAGATLPQRVLARIGRVLGSVWGVIALVVLVAIALNIGSE
jgi:hypothetical protein